MKRFVTALPLFFFALSLCGAEVISLNRDWKFFTQEATNTDNVPVVNLPHTWNADVLSGKADYYRGMGTYLKQVNIPSGWAGKRIYLRFHGVNLTADVFVNGRLAGEHKGGYVPFCVDITKLVRHNRNNYIWVSVNNSLRYDVLPTAGDMNSYGGILRGVELVATDMTSLIPGAYGAEGIKIIQKSATVEKVEGETQVAVVTDRERTVGVQLTLFSPAMDTVFNTVTRLKLQADNASVAKIPFTINKPSLWNGTISPYLYNVGVKVTDGATLCDSTVIQTGFRTIAFDPSGGLLLNGMPYHLRGVKIRQDRAVAGAAISAGDVMEDFNLIREMGANAVRVVGVPHHPLFYHLCDRAGIVVWSDFPFTGGNFITDKAFIPTKAFMDSGQSQALEIISRQFNHPSVIMWGIFSDLSVRGDDPVEYVRRLNELVKKEDPSRLTVASSNQDGEINFITDLIVWNQHLGWREGLPEDIGVWLRQLRDSWGNLASGISYGAGGAVSQQDESLRQPRWNSNWHPEGWQSHLHEVYIKALAGSSLWGTFVDLFEYGSASYPWGEGRGVNDLGLVTFDRRTRKDAFFLYKANWNLTDPFIYIAGKRGVVRTGKVQTITVYTNRTEAELMANGVSYGVKDTENGMVSWPVVELQNGVNKITVYSGTLTDSAEIVIR